ncbi:sensor histidine kinase [Cohnella faecalis]|uniref:Histidine kinase/HSP90-like ATPase domain-containing protein n=1 Tax=Cohnella faecalis TaxID=2315694 RepID=A0A398CHY7_9BACL|nr:ATP-binding protein [Cohnella faecalis]RIE00498.1 hypothetical protein D3H35_28205 [Cohnella faecalis]
MKKGQGLIRVRGRKADGGDIIFEVEDNGGGMTAKQADALLADESIADPQAKGSGIGIRNVNQRIRYIFGKDYGVTVNSVPEKGQSSGSVSPLHCQRRHKQC